MFVVGDSLTVGTRRWLPTQAARVGVTVNGVDARVGRPTAEGLAVLRREGADLPPTVLVALGTNDLEASSGEAINWVEEARILVGTRRLIWVNVRCGPLEGIRLRQCRRINAALAAAATWFSVELADWDAWADANDVATTADGIHHRAPAYRQRARFYAEAVAGVVGTPAS